MSTTNTQTPANISNPLDITMASLFDVSSVSPVKLEQTFTAIANDLATSIPGLRHKRDGEEFTFQNGDTIVKVIASNDSKMVVVDNNTTVQDILSVQNDKTIRVPFSAYGDETKAHEIANEVRFQFLEGIDIPTLSPNAKFVYEINEDTNEFHVDINYMLHGKSIKMATLAGKIDWKLGVGKVTPKGGTILKAQQGIIVEYNIVCMEFKGPKNKIFINSCLAYASNLFTRKVLDQIMFKPATIKELVTLLNNMGKTLNANEVKELKNLISDEIAISTAFPTRSATNDLVTVKGLVGDKPTQYLKNDALMKRPLSLIPQQNEEMALTAFKNLVPQELHIAEAFIYLRDFKAKDFVGAWQQLITQIGATQANGGENFSWYNSAFADMNQVELVIGKPVTANDNNGALADLLSKLLKQ